MIASIDHEADVNIFLEPSEIEKLPNETIDGVLIKLFKPKQQGTITISINNKRSLENGFGIGFYDKNYWGVSDNFHLEIFMGIEYYQAMKEKGVIGLRHRMKDGSKIHIHDRSKLDGLMRSGANDLEFYKNNKERLPADWG